MKRYPNIEKIGQGNYLGRGADGTVYKIFRIPYPAPEWVAVAEKAPRRLYGTTLGILAGRLLQTI
jgi:hypothetical protein